MIHKLPAWALTGMCLWPMTRDAFVKVVVFLRLFQVARVREYIRLAVRHKLAEQQHGCAWILTGLSAVVPTAILRLFTWYVLRHTPEMWSAGCFDALDVVHTPHR